VRSSFSSRDLSLIRLFARQVSVIGRHHDLFLTSKRSDTMVVAVSEPKQHKQPSRKGKRAWRKNVDITSVQQGLESLREETRQGGPMAEKPSDELFTIDTAGSEEIKKKHKLPKPLKADQILAERSAVPAVDSRKRPHSKIGDGIIDPVSKRQRKEWVSKKEVQRLKHSISKQSHLDTEGNEGGVTAEFDLWSQAPEENTTVTSQDEYVPKPTPKVAPPTIKQAPLAMTATGEAIKAIQDPDAGTSYNPSFEAWDDLLNREGAKEVEAEEVRQQRSLEAAEKEARIAAIAAADDREAHSDYESAWEGFETDNDEQTLKRKRPERKTPAQRNKIKRRQREEQTRRHEVAMGKKQKQSEQVAIALIKASESQDVAPTVTEADGKEASAETRLRRRKLGTIAIPQKPLELVLPDELQESLRRLRPEGNLMSDRFRNLLVNGKIESRKPVVQARKKRVKMTEKWSYKDFEIAA
jgi:nucleolar protein 53